MHYNRCYLLLLLLGVTVGCSNSTEEESSGAFVSGQIRNPTSDYVVILKNNVPLDTISLDDTNRFNYKIPDVEEGLYLFKHPPHNLDFHLQDGDSLLLRTNTIDFDESLHFSGIGGEKNNLLAEIFLLNEQNTQILLAYHEIEPVEFSRKADSIRNERKKALQEKHEKFKFSDNFLKTAEKTIRYDCYDLRERYTYMVNKYHRPFAKQITPDFQAYRQNADFNDASFQTSPGYIRFIENYLINQAMAECARANLDHNNCYDLYDHGNITTRIKIIDTLTDLPLVREHFFSKLGGLGIVMASEREEIVSVLELLKEKNYPEHKLEGLEQTGNIQLAYLPGMNVGNVNLSDTQGNEKLFREISSEPTVLFLWSIHSPKKHQRNHETINNLREKYPEVNFMAVNIDSNETSKWIEAVHSFGYDPSQEYQLTTTRIRKDAFQNYLNKSLLLNGSGEVVIGDAYINSPEFETRILELLNP